MFALVLALLAIVSCGGPPDPQHPVVARPPSPGIPTSGWYPWLVAPAVLCVTGQPPQWLGEKWSCL